jgi:hypothetical protein
MQKEIWYMPLGSYQTVLQRKWFVAKHPGLDEDQEE